MSLQFLPLPADENWIHQEIARDAFANGIGPLIYPSGWTPSTLEHNLAAMARGDAQYPDRNKRFKVVDPTLPADDPYKGVIGVSQWRIYRHARGAEDLEAEKARADADSAAHGPPPGMDMAFMGDFLGALETLKARLLGGKPYIYLHILATRPGFQRKGVGAVSLKWGAETADELGLPIYLESSPQGVELYRRWGFEPVERVPIDVRDYGAKYELWHTVMIRRPKTKEAAAA